MAASGRSLLIVTIISIAVGPTSSSFKDAGGSARMEASVAAKHDARLAQFLAMKPAPAAAGVEAFQRGLDLGRDAQHAEAVQAFVPEAHTVPYCMSGGTDAKQFSRLGITGYGFAPLQLPPSLDFSAMFHGVDERVPTESLRFGTRVLDRLLSTC